ncbi:MAG: glycosyltransferase family 4 protein [Acuticoccus sp.]
MHAPRSRKILLVANAAWNLANFRARLIGALTAAGDEVVAAAPPDAATARLAALGCRTVPLAMDPRGTSAARDLALLVRLARLVRTERPDVVLTYTIKPNIYGALAARLAGVPVVATVTGLGTAFLAPGAAAMVARPLYRLAFAGAATVVFQNAADRDVFVNGRLVAERRTALVPGSGVDLARFRPAPIPADGPPRFLFVGRLLAEKGVGEFVEAARRIGRQRARFALLGEAPEGAALPPAVAAAIADGTVTHLGAVTDVRPHIAQAHAVVLPSYREGTSRALLEAAAMARPLIASDVPGCREALSHGGNGLLCAPRDGAALASAMAAFLALGDAARAAMGRASRQIAETRFDEEIVVARMTAAIDAALRQRGCAAA